MIKKIEATWHHLVEGGEKEKQYRKVFKFIFILLLLFLWANAAIRATRGHGSQYDDFTEFSNDLIFERINLYQEYSFEVTSIGKYPPFFGVVYAPVNPLPVPVGAALWFGLNAFLIFLSSKYLAKAIWRFNHGGEIPKQLHQAYWLAPLTLISVNAITNLETSQVNIFIFFLVSSGIYLFSQRKDWSAGLILGVAIAIKITPAIFIAYLFYKRAWKIVFGSILGLLICWGPLLMLLMGLDFYQESMQSWFDILITYVGEGTMAEGMGGFRHTNQSLDAVFFRTFTHTEANGGFDDFYLNIMSIDYDLAGKIVKGIKIALLLGMIYLFRKPFKSRFNSRIGLEMSIVSIAMLYISPISWINHYVAMILPLTVGVFWLRKTDLEPELKKKLKISLLFCGISLLLPQRIVQAFSIPFLGSLILGVFYIKMLTKKEWHKYLAS